MATESHDQMLRAMQEYIKWQDRWEYKKSEEASIKARFWLAEVRRHAKLRRQEILDSRTKLQQSRKGKPGRPPKLIK